MHPHFYGPVTTRVTFDDAGLAAALASPAPGTEPAPASLEPVAARMAEAMIRMNARQGGGCTEADLLDQGFSLEDVLAHGAHARRLACTRFVREAA